VQLVVLGEAAFRFSWMVLLDLFVALGHLMIHFIFPVWGGLGRRGGNDAGVLRREEKRLVSSYFIVHYVEKI
jgi:hypothetical protein